MSRIYQTKHAGVTFEGQQQSVGFNPQQAVNEDKKIQQYKQAIIQDGQTINREISRVQQAENLALQSLQNAQSGAQKISQQIEGDELKGSQLYDRGVLAAENLARKQELDQNQLYEKLNMEMDASSLKAKGSLQLASMKFQAQALQGILSFAGNTIGTIGKVQQIQQAEALKAEQEAAYNMQMEQANAMVFGDNFWEAGQGMDPNQIEVSEGVDIAVQADATARGDVASDISAGGTAEDTFVAEQVQAMSEWNMGSDVRGNVYAARMQYPAFIQSAIDQGLIRPGAQGMADIARLNKKFAIATGLTSADPKFVYENFTKSALGVAQNALTGVTATAGREMKSEREANARTNMDVAMNGVPVGGSTEQLGGAWDAANRENVNGVYGGRNSMAANQDTTERTLKGLADQGRAADIRSLADYEYNPNRKGATLGKDFPTLFSKYERQARITARQDYNLQKSENGIEVDGILQDYWEGPKSPDSLRATEQKLRALGEDGRKAADNLVKNGYNYNQQAEIDIARRRGTSEEASVAELQDLYSKGIISEQFYTRAVKQAPDTKTSKKIDEALKLYQPEKGITDNMVPGPDGKGGMQYNPTNASPRFKQELRMKQKRFNIQLKRRLGAILRSNPDLEIESEEFQQIVQKEQEYLLKSPDFQIFMDVGNGGYQFKESRSGDQEFVDRITLTPGKQNVIGLSPEQVLDQGGVSVSQLDPTQDTFITQEQLLKDSEAIIQGGATTADPTTRKWAARLGLGTKAFVDGQRKLYGLPPLDQLQRDPSPTGGGAMPQGDIKNEQEGVRAFEAAGIPTRGAAYLSSAVLHESAWRGNRSWGEVAGDGTNRNGGLLSWASWANDPARLGKIEREYGMPIDKIPEHEQVKYIVKEMRTSYPESYRIFMNPNASSADLQWATWNFIRWDKRYTGARWTDAERLIRWAT